MSPYVSPGSSGCSQGAVSVMGMSFCMMRQLLPQEVKHGIIRAAAKARVAGFFDSLIDPVFPLFPGFLQGGGLFGHPLQFRRRFGPFPLMGGYLPPEGVPLALEGLIFVFKGGVMEI